MITPFFLKGLLIALLSGLIAGISLLCLVPPISRDALIHHLKVPQLYVERGGLYEIPSMVFSYNPMNLDLLYIIPLYFGNDILPKFIHFTFGLLTAWLIFIYLRSKCGYLYGLLGALLFLSVPIIVKLSITVYVDLGLIFFTTASLLLFLRWIENDFQFKYLISSAIFCGLALGTKYNGLIPFFILTALAPFVYSRLNSEHPGFIRSMAQGVVFCIVALLIYSPWGIRNYFWKGNPIYPLYQDLFVKESIEDSTNTPVGVSPVAHRRLIYGESVWQVLLLPVRVFFQGEDSIPQFFDGKMNPYLLILPFFAFISIHRETKIFQGQKKILLFFAVLVFFFSSFSAILRIRYISPIIPPLTILSVLGVRNIVEWIGHQTRPNERAVGWGFLTLFLMVFLGFNARYVYGQFQYVRPFEYLTGRVSRDEYITRYRPEYPVMQYVNENLPADSLLLFVFIGNRGYYCKRPYVFDMEGFRSKLTSITMALNSPKEIAIELERLGITHLLVRLDSMIQWISQQLSPGKQELFKAFISQHTTLLFSNDQYGVARIRSKKEK